MEKKDILCPDCLVDYISETRFANFGKCMSCYRRETVANANGYKYVMFKDLPDDEKARITHQRAVKKSSYAKRKSKKSSIKEVSKMEVLNGSNNEKNKAGRKSIYTPELIEEIKTIANENITPSQLLGILKGLHPELNLTSSNLNNIINRHNIVHSSARGRKAKNIVDINADNELNLDNEIELEDDTQLDNLENNEIKCNQEDEVSNSNIDTLEITKQTSQLQCNEPERFKPVREEIDNLLNIKFRRMNCSIEKDYTTDDYINMIEMLIYLKSNRDTIIKNRRSQQNIMNAYQSDALHEVENAILEDGNTYLSDKMHILRKYRRYYESDYKNVSILKPFLELLDIDTMQKVLDALKKNKTYIDKPVFKPLVDTTMVDKYDWAKSMDLSSNKSNISIIHYNPMTFTKSDNNGRPVTRIGVPEKTPPTSQLNSKMRRALKVFRVSCKISGGGYGVFKEWYRDYECTSSKTALAYATNTLNQLASTRKGMYWTDLDVIELNVGPVKSE